MNEIILQTIIVGLVALFSAIIGGVLPNIIQSKTDKLAMKRSKLEELYINIEKWYISSFNIMSLQFSLVLNKHIDWNTYLDNIISSEKGGDHIKSEIILFLYFSHLEKDFIALKKSVQEVDRFINEDIKKTYLSGSNVAYHTEEHRLKVLDATHRFNILKNKMNKTAKKLK